MSTQATSQSVLKQDEIANRAREIWRAVGCLDGHDLECWLRAEAELLGIAPPIASSAKTITHPLHPARRAVLPIISLRKITPVADC